MSLATDGLEPLAAGGFKLEFGARTLVMGVLNVTPDSFSGDGFGSDVDGAVARAERMVKQGADIIDIGGESTRPDATPVPPQEEIDRVIPVIHRLVRTISVPISIDTRKADVAERALASGATIVNDIWGLQGDDRMASVVAAAQPVGLVAMHNQRGTKYDDLMTDIRSWLARSIEIATGAGIARSQVIVDPGFGFGKNPAQNLEMVGRLAELKQLGVPILIGPSKKSTLGLVAGTDTIAEREEASLALMALSIANGADIVRMHDVRGSHRVRVVTDEVVRGISGRVRALRSPGATL